MSLYLYDSLASIWQAWLTSTNTRQRILAAFLIHGGRWQGSQKGLAAYCNISRPTLISHLNAMHEEGTLEGEAGDLRLAGIPDSPQDLDTEQPVSVQILTPERERPVHRPARVKELDTEQPVSVQILDNASSGRVLGTDMDPTPVKILDTERSSSVENLYRPRAGSSLSTGAHVGAGAGSRYKYKETKEKKEQAGSQAARAHSPARVGHGQQASGPASLSRQEVEQELAQHWAALFPPGDFPRAARAPRLPEFANVAVMRTALVDMATRRDTITSPIKIWGLVLGDLRRQSKPTFTHLTRSDVDLAIRGLATLGELALDGEGDLVQVPARPSGAEPEPEFFEALPPDLEARFKGALEALMSMDQTKKTKEAS